MTNWYYYGNGKKNGTVTGGQLKWLAKNGKITPKTLLETEDGKSVFARQVKGLTFCEAAPPDEPATFSFLCPHCQSTLQAKKKSAGKTKQCPTCKQSFTVPAFVVPMPPVETEIYGLSQPPKPPTELNSFTVPISESANPFTFDSYIVAPLAELNPFTEPMPGVNNTTAQDISVSDVQSGGSWQVTLIGTVLLLIVGGIGWHIISTTSPTPEQARVNKTDVIAADTPDRPIVVENHIKPMNPGGNRPLVVNENPITPTNPGNNRPSVNVGLDWALVNYEVSIALTNFSEAVFEKNIMTNNETELIAIIAEVKFVDYSPYSCSNAFLNAHKELVERMTELSIARSVLANAKRRGESANYVNHSEMAYRRLEQPFLNAQKKFWDLHAKENVRIERENK